MKFLTITHFVLAVLLVTGCRDRSAQAPSADVAERFKENAAPSNRIDVPESVRRNLGITFAKVEQRSVARTIRVPGRFEFAPGWELCERRYDTIPAVTLRRPFRIPRLEERKDAKRVAVWREQGVGDQILYSTLLPELARRGTSVSVEVDKRLVAAYRRAHPG